jgi:hypothetical protein
LCDVPLASSAEVRLREAASLPEVLDAGYAAFEAIRITARACQDQVPGLFAAFTTTADAAVDGREALTVAPSLPRRSGSKSDHASSADAGAGQAIDVLAQLAAVLRERLAEADGKAGLPGDQAACHDAASAAGRICQLMTR